MKSAKQQFLPLITKSHSEVASDCWAWIAHYNTKLKKKKPNWLVERYVRKIITTGFAFFWPRDPQPRSKLLKMVLNGRGHWYLWSCRYVQVWLKYFSAMSSLKVFAMQTRQNDGQRPKFASIYAHFLWRFVSKWACLLKIVSNTKSR